MREGKNLIAGIANSTISALIGLVVVPLYLKYLGVEAYGLIGFFTTIQAMLQFLDLGLAATINREIARYSADGKIKDAGKLLHTLEIIYWITGALIAIMIIALSPLIAKYWLKTNTLPLETISHSIMLMGIVISCRWPIGLYQGSLIGAQRLNISSIINILMVLIGNFGSIAILSYISSTIEAFFIWQTSIAIIYTAIIRFAAWQVIGRDKNTKFDINVLKSIWRFSLGMTGIALSSLAFTQLDKILLSKMIGLEEFGHYMLATLVVSALYFIISPMFNVIYPRFCILVRQDNSDKIIELYRLGTRFLSSLIFPISMILFFFGKDLVFIWTGNPEIATKVSPIISFLAIGSSLHGVMHFPYALQLANGMTKLPLFINIILSIILIPLIVFFTINYGAIGGAVAWLILEVLYLIFGSYITHYYLLKISFLNWLIYDVGISFGISIIIVYCGSVLVNCFITSIYIKLIFMILLVTITIIVSILSSVKLRKFTMSYLHTLYLKHKIKFDQEY